MENPSRREFIKQLLGIGAISLFMPTNLFGFSKRSHIELIKKRVEYFHKKGKKRGGRVLIIGGIHGNEIGAYKAADLLVDVEVKRGELFIIPRSNFESILADLRGYNGDMNRKFSHISKRDADFYKVAFLKEAIKEIRPNVVLSLHDGYGFNIKNPRHWGQSVVIDEKRYKYFNLYSIANYVLHHSNKYLYRYKLGLINTKTFSSTLHKEQRNALTGWCLKNGIMAFCNESSKQLKLDDKIYTHLLMLREYFKLFSVEISPSIDYLIKHFKKLSPKHYYSAVLDINGRRYRFNHSSTIKIKKGSNIKVVSLNGGRGSYLVAKGVNLNWNSFHFRSHLNLVLKDDYKSIFKLKILQGV